MKELKLGMLDIRYKGREPNPPFVEKEIDLVGYYNWYNYFYDKSLWKDWTLEYNKSIGNKYNISKAPEKLFINATGAKAKMLLNGTKLAQIFVDRLHEDLKRIEDECKKEQVSQEEPSIEKDVMKNYETIVADIEDKLDEFYNNNYSSTFSLYDFLTRNQVSKNKAELIKQYYAPVLEDVKSNKSDYMRDKNQYNRYIAFLKMLVDDADKFVENKVSSRKPRKKKEPKLEDKLKKLSYKKDNVGLKLVSIKPENVFGAKAVVMYNDKYRHVTVLYAESDKTLEIKGSTIYNVDTAKSFMKTVRKPETLSNLLSGSLKSVINNINTITSKSKFNVSGRVNSETLLLKAFK